MSAGGTFSWFCTADQPAASIPNGAGALCYADADACASGINACDDAHPCVVDYTECSTGSAANTAAIWFCPLDPPTGSISNGAQSRRLLSARGRAADARAGGAARLRGRRLRGVLLPEPCQLHGRPQLVQRAEPVRG